MFSNTFAMKNLEHVQGKMGTTALLIKVLLIKRKVSEPYCFQLSIRDISTFSSGLDVNYQTHEQPETFTLRMRRLFSVTVQMLVCRFSNLLGVKCKVGQFADTQHPHPYENSSQNKGSPILPKRYLRSPDSASCTGCCTCLHSQHLRHNKLNCVSVKIPQCE